jgi:YHS domain-containing protein
MRRIMAVLLLANVALSASALHAEASWSEPALMTRDEAPVRNTKESAVDAKQANPLAIKGYDPVARFPEAEGEPKKGKAEFEYVFEGVTYRFASAANRDRFVQSPARYEPAYGGWCAWAMREGDKVEVDPRFFIVKDGRLFLFYKDLFTNTRTQWRKGDHAAYAAESDGRWRAICGESPRSHDDSGVAKESRRPRPIA